MPKLFSECDTDEWLQIADQVPMELVPAVVALRSGKSWAEACEAANRSPMDRHVVRAELMASCPKVINLLEEEERRWLAVDAQAAVRELMKSERASDRDRAIKHARAIAGMDAPSRSIVSTDDEDILPLSEPTPEPAGGADGDIDE